MNKGDILFWSGMALICLPGFIVPLAAFQIAGHAVAWGLWMAGASWTCGIPLMLTGNAINSSLDQS